MQNIEDSLVIQKAKRLWDFLCGMKSREKSDIIIVCGSYDLRVCDYACELLKEGFANKLLFSGNTGNWTKYLWSETEASVFYKRARNLGVASESIIIEDKATNLSENVLFSCKLIPEASNVIFITKPNTVLRLSLTIPMNNSKIKYYVDAPHFEFPWDVSNVIGILGLIDEMVGDLQRIIEYPMRGFQKPCDVPIEILDSWKFLIAEGFDKHLIKSTK